MIKQKQKQNMKLVSDIDGKRFNLVKQMENKKQMNKSEANWFKQIMILLKIFYQIQIQIQININLNFQNKPLSQNQPKKIVKYPLIPIQFLFLFYQLFIHKLKNIIYIQNSTKMTQYGYDKSRFPNLTGQAFDCIICSCIARNPKQCNGCGNLYCTACINDWLKKNNSCPNRCTATVSPMSSKVLIKMYNDLDIKCQYFDKCKRLIKLLDLQKHEQQCGRTKCWNTNLCQGNQNVAITQKSPCCSTVCVVLKKIIDANGDQKKIYDQIKKTFGQNSSIALNHSNSSSNSNNNIIPFVNKSLNSNTSIKWDNTKSGTGIQITQQGQQAFLKEQSYVFRTIIADMGFNSGVNYWEIVADVRTQNQLKIGVTTSKQFDFNSAFCDHAFGYAYYGLGQLRHNSNASGGQYGKRFKKDGVLGVCLNMNKGTLSFALNGEYMGIAFTAQNLKKGPIYPAVSLLHCAGCKIRGGILPAYFKD